MSPENNTKEKILALITVLFLFSIMGGLFFSISLDNKHKTEALKAEVERINAKRKILENFSNLGIASSTLAGVSAESYLTLAVTDDGANKILQQKNPDYSLPIASLTKLMVAVIALENFDPQAEIKATLDYIGQEESVFVLETDKIYRVKELLANMLIASDNDSARLLAGTFGMDNFITKMNAKAEDLGLTKTIYFNVTGLDPKKPDMNANLSSPNDLAKLLIYIKTNHPEILKLTTNTSYDFCDTNNYCKLISSTDKLLSDKNFKYKITGGKTGSTDLALKNLALMTNISESISVINIVLGSKDHFTDTQILINNIKQ